MNIEFAPTLPSPPLRVLLVDDDVAQLKLNSLRLRDAGFEVEAATNADDALEKALLRAPDVILSDVLMGDHDGFTLCRAVREDSSLDGVPVVLASAHCHEEQEQQLAFSVGAAALVQRTPEFEAELAALRRSLASRGRPSGRVPNLRSYELHLRSNAHQITKLLGQARSAEERYRLLFQGAHDCISILTPEGVILDANERWRDVFGVGPEEMIGHHIREYAAPGHEASNDEGYRRSTAARFGRHQAVPLKRPDGHLIHMEFSNSTIEIDGRKVVFATGRDVTEHVLSAESLAEAEERYRSLVERIPDVIWTCRGDAKLTYMTPNVEQVLGFTIDEMCVDDVAARSLHVHPDDRQAVVQAFARLMEHGAPFDLEYRRQRKDGEWIWVRNRSTAIYERDGARYVDGMLTDVTERKRLEESLRQAQKIEAIGQLTGGIAHDFNNILSAILANSHFLMEDLAENDPRRADAEQIKAAAEKGAALTRQLLAFSRKQILEPTTVDLNDAIGGLERMLRRLIGEDIDLHVAGAGNLGLTRVDVGQLEQVVMNLVVNARDAMPNGGKLSIETTNADLDDEYAASHVGAVPGHYVVVTVSDTGCGMDAATQRRIFEPFFTTKEVGKGTGLGLSTCYGIVKQSGGHIWVYSEPGHGTVFKVYLPRVDGRIAQSSSRPSLAAVTARGETILVVEDDERVRAAVTRILETRGYRLLVARNGAEALEIAGRQQGDINLVLSDVIMPGAAGPEVVAHLAAKRPGVRALYMSGYTDHPMLSDGALQGSLSFVQKPFTPETLARKVRETLDAPIVALQTRPASP